MKNATHRGAKKRRQPYFVAMVLGTALSALGASNASRAADVPDTTKAVNAITRYCTVCWRNARLHPDSWTDCTQEVFSRLMERVALDTWGNVLKDGDGLERREFLRAIDTVKKRTQRSRQFKSSSDDAIADPRDASRRERADERAAVAEAANHVLTPRQRQVVEKSLDGWSVHDIATELRLPPERVSDEKYKAIRKLRERLAPSN